jgi:hypothetical protein
MPPQHQSTPIHCNLTLVYHHVLSLHASYGLDWGVYGSVQNVSGTDLVPGIGLGQVTPGLTPPLGKLTPSLFRVPKNGV